MPTSRRFVGPPPRLLGRGVQNFLAELDDYLWKVWNSEGDGIPSGFGEAAPTTIQAGASSGAGNGNQTGWMAADATFEIETGAPTGPIALGSVAAEGTGTSFMRASATFNTQTLLAQIRNVMAWA